MTRETKIGLLVGLGFIIVFAVLLSHNGTGPSPTQTLPPIASASPSENATPASTTLTPPPVVEPAPGPVIPVDNGPEGAPAWRDQFVGGLASGTGEDLPEPPGLERPGVILDGPSAGDGDSTGMLASADDPRDSTAGSVRVVPPVVAPAEPEPTLRPPGPVTTEPPIGPGTEVSRGTPGEPTDGNGHASPTPSKPYVVHKGDTLVKITKEVYGKSTPAVISFVVDANKGVIKGRDSLREGQTIVTPPLPPDMFEPTSTVAGGVDLKKVGDLLNQTDRRTPESTGPKPAPGNAKPGQSNIPDTGTGAKGGYIPARGAKPESTPEAKPDKPAGTDKKNDAINKAASPPKADAGKPATPPKGGKKEPTAAPKRRPSLRLYEIQPKDTFTSIAQRELGSGSRWAEIKQMNKDVDPSKMKPGMKIKIPSREPVSVQVSEKQASV